MGPHPTEERLRSADRTPQSAPRDGRAIRGWFERGVGQGAEVKAVSWDAQDAAWVDLAGVPVEPNLTLPAWGPD